jgi:hypothetical protein
LASVPLRFSDLRARVVSGKKGIRDTNVDEHSERERERERERVRELESEREGDGSVCAFFQTYLFIAVLSHFSTSEVSFLFYYLLLLIIFS